ncbi:hypothetical protein DL96DRAFT_1559413 [Flagelloscypha sp. PMI_526]|nr:hypothetical protein DL96DRAFT_1559413 [Flagelloscypha sp. PMI_526]
MASPLSEIELRTHITLGSCFLAALKWSGPSFRMPRVSKELVMLHHLTTLLSSKSALHAQDRLVAITGPATRNGFSVLLVPQNCSSDDAQSEQVNLREVKPSSESCDEILSTWATRAIDNPDKYVADLLKIFAESDLRDKRLIFYALRYSAGKRGAFDIIAEYCAKLQPERPFPWKITIPVAVRKYIKKLVPEGSPEADGKLHFFLERSGLRGWVNFIDSLLTKIRDTLGTEKKYELRDDIGEEDFEMIATGLFVLEHVLDARVLDEILTDPSLCKALEEARQQKSLLAQSGTSDHVKTSLDARQEEEDVLVGQNKVHHRHLLIQYLNSLCAWPIAVVKLHNFIRKSSLPPTVHRLTLSSLKPKNSFFSHLDYFIESVVFEFPEGEKKKEIRDEMQRIMTKVVFSDNPLRNTTVINSNTPTYHVEAMAMALGAAIQDDNHFLVDSAPHLQTLQSIFLPYSKTFIGVNKKCCWFCWRLCMAYNKAGPGYEIEATHGKVYPWAAPPFGVSASILEDIWKDLKRIIIDESWNRVQVARSLRSAVASESAGFADESPVLDYFPDGEEIYHRRMSKGKSDSRT